MATLSLKTGRACATVIVLIYLFMAKTEGDGHMALSFFIFFFFLLGTYGTHLSPFAAIGLNDFIN